MQRLSFHEPPGPGSAGIRDPAHGQPTRRPGPQRHLDRGVALGPRPVLRASWGHYYQAQAVHEPNVADGDTTFSRASALSRWPWGWSGGS